MPDSNFSLYRLTVEPVHTAKYQNTVKAFTALWSVDSSQTELVRTMADEVSKGITDYGVFVSQWFTKGYE